jgi:hypothetical protein
MWAFRPVMLTSKIAAAVPPKMVALGTFPLRAFAMMEE